MGEFKNQEQGFLASNVSGNTVNSPKGYSKFQVKGMIEWGKKEKKPKKSLGLPAIPQKIPESEMSNPKKSFDSSPSLEIRSTPHGVNSRIADTSL